MVLIGMEIIHLGKDKIKNAHFSVQIYKYGY